jgi:NADH dehydrogenase FAD-containing subunit
MSSKSAPQTLVILGAGIGGLPLAHHVLRFTSPKAPNLRVILVSPDTHFYWTLASPRAILSEDFTDQLFLPLTPAFASYGDKIELVHGKATVLDPKRNSVVVSLADGGSREIIYDAVVVATGSRDAQGMPWKALDSTEATKKVLHGLKHKIDEAKTIVIAGAGPTGVEVAGELGELSASGSKEVIYIIPEDQPLALPAKPHVRKAVRDALEKLKVRIVSNMRVAAATETAGAKTTLELKSPDGKTQTIVADVYLSAFGLKPNTEFVPASMLAPSGRIKQTKRLRAEGHDNVFVVGDAGNLEDTRAMVADAQSQYVAKALQAYFTGSEAAAVDYKPNENFMIGVSIGRNTGVGQAMGMKLFSWVIWYFKSRTLGVDKVGDIVAGVLTAIGGKMKG